MSYEEDKSRLIEQTVEDQAEPAKISEDELDEVAGGASTRIRPNNPRQLA